ncbi:hypothetical protein BT96DRAFT_913563 [Gymnopus androsaceus JB14]|uniref:Uncharacterized protein n=1 Tax=Gymnopus androsaceus JB14 TaxID=1447944 RepID=A0A6A4IHW8_9AGAR|nr:hypothetical protein BT96DRAFT_913563 [Gymnopus androsaceus JB14]
MAHGSSTNSNHYKPPDLLSPFLDIPNEIVCVIFELACTDNFLQEYPWPLDQEREPAVKLTLPVITYLPTLAISAVCTRWRSLALASPSLWSHLSLETTPATVSDVQGGFTSTLQLYLDRSVDTPLTIGLRTTGTLYSHIISSGSPALNLLLQHTCRWKNFSYIGDYKLKQYMDSSLSFPILENLSLSALRSAIRLEDLGCFANAPKLHMVKTDDPEIHSDLPWTQLTSLDVRTPRDIDLLRRCRCLAVLKLQSFWSKFGPGSVSLASLKSFTFIDSTQKCHRKLLENMFLTLTFPSLTELFMYSEDGSGESLIWPLDAFNGFISRSSCTLTTLSLSSVTISDVDLISALHLLPSLTKFSTEALRNPKGRSPITSHFILNMHSSSTTPLLPKLRCLSIKSHGTSFDDSAFVSMVSSRWIPDRSLEIDCLRSLVLCFLERKVEEVNEIYKPLWNLDRMGMRVVITGTEMSGTKV